jgi:hypothetical protein
MYYERIVFAPREEIDWQGPGYYTPTNEWTFASGEFIRWTLTGAVIHAKHFATKPTPLQEA